MVVSATIHYLKAPNSGVLLAISSDKLFVPSMPNPYLMLAESNLVTNSEWNVIELDVVLRNDITVNGTTLRQEIVLARNDSVSIGQVIEAVESRIVEIDGLEDRVNFLPHLSSDFAVRNEDVWKKSELRYEANGFTGMITVQVLKLANSSYLIIVDGAEDRGKLLGSR